MYYFVVDGNPIANADDPVWLEYLKDRYPYGVIVYKPLPTIVEPVVQGAQPL